MDFEKLYRYFNPQASEGDFLPYVDLHRDEVDEEKDDGREEVLRRVLEKRLRTAFFSPPLLRDESNLAAVPEAAAKSGTYLRCIEYFPFPSIFLAGVVYCRQKRKMELFRVTIRLQKTFCRS